RAQIKRILDYGFLSSSPLAQIVSAPAQIRIASKSDSLRLGAPDRDILSQSMQSASFGLLIIFHGTAAICHLPSSSLLLFYILFPSINIFY
ncbi:AAEL007833-PA, partial [Aedes aegypti]